MFKLAHGFKVQPRGPLYRRNGARGRGPRHAYSSSTAAFYAFGPVCAFHCD